jgi:hypothetical protein
VADMKFILLHEARNDDGIRSFFMDVWELYVKASVYAYVRRVGRICSTMCHLDYVEPVSYGTHADSQRGI